MHFFDKQGTGVLTCRGYWNEKNTYEISMHFFPVISCVSRSVVRVPQIFPASQSGSSNVKYGNTYGMVCAPDCGLLTVQFLNKYCIACVTFLKIYGKRKSVKNTTQAYYFPSATWS